MLEETLRSFAVTRDLMWSSQGCSSNTEIHSLENKQVSNRTKFYIGGEWVDPSSDATLDVVNPASEQSIGVVAMGTPTRRRQSCGGSC